MNFFGSDNQIITHASIIFMYFQKNVEPHTSMEFIPAIMWVQYI